MIKNLFVITGFIIVIIFLTVPVYGDVVLNKHQGFTLGIFTGVLVSIMAFYISDITNNNKR